MTDIPLQGAAPKAAKGMSDEDELPAVSIYGDLAGAVTSIPSCMLSLVVRTGQLDDQTRILVPMTELRLTVGDDEDDSDLGLEDDLIATVVPLENAFFLVAELASELAGACEELTAFSSAHLHPEPRRIAHCRNFLAEAQQSLARCLTHLEVIGAIGNERID